MKVNIQGLINRLDSLRERLNDLFDNLDTLEELEQEEIEIDTIREYFYNGDTFNLIIATDVLEQADKLDRALEIIKEKTLTINDLYWLKNGNYQEYKSNLEILYSGVEEEHLQKILKTHEEFDLLKEVLLRKE